MHACITQATRYYQIMKKRVDEEQPEYFEEKGLDADEFKVDFIKEICFEEVAKHNAANRSRQADLASKYYLND